MHCDEIWQLYYKNGEPIPGEGWDSARDNPYGDDTEIVGVAIVFLYRVRNDGEVEFLWQKRAEEIDRFPGYYDLSAGGHINLGETAVEAAIREAHEEIGADIAADDLQYGFMQPFNKNRFAWLYFVDWGKRADEFSFNDREVSEVRWVKYSEMDEFVQKNAKPPLANDRAAFVLIDEWMRMHGYNKLDKS